MANWRQKCLTGRVFRDWEAGTGPAGPSAGTFLVVSSFCGARKARTDSGWQPRALMAIPGPTTTLSDP